MRLPELYDKDCWLKLYGEPYGVPAEAFDCYNLDKILIKIWDTYKAILADNVYKENPLFAYIRSKGVKSNKAN